MMTTIEAQVVDSSHLKLNQPISFPMGTRLIITVISSKDEKGKKESNCSYFLRGKPIRYTNPFLSVAEEEWNALNGHS